MSAGSANADATHPEFFKDAAATNKQIKLVWLGAGKTIRLWVKAPKHSMPC